MGDRPQRHAHRVPRGNYAPRRDLRHERAVRLALPHPRPRGPRHDAADGDRQAAGPERMSANTRKEGDMYSRRDVTRSTIAGLAGLLMPALGAVKSAGAVVTGADATGGVRLGVQTSSFRDLPRQADRDSVDALILALNECGTRECELFAPQVEPIGLGGHAAGHHATVASMTPQMMRRELRKWRLRAPIAQFASIGGRLQKAGVSVHAYNYSPDSTFSDEEIDRGFAMAKALGAEIITASMTLEQARRAA